MGMETRMRQIFDEGESSSPHTSFVTIGTVVDTNDPQQMGRLRVVCPQWGDTWGAVVEDLPWAVYISPFGGITQVGTRGPGIQESEGSIAYGVWAIPKVGAQVAVMCVDGNPATRMWFGCLYDQFTPHTMPHGRYMYDDHPALEKQGTMAAPYGPYTSSEKLIHPLAENLQQSFGNKAEPNFEYRSRGADYQVSRVDIEQLNQTYSQAQDDKDVHHGDWISTQGYQASRTDPFAPSSITDKSYDSLAFAVTTPGFHSFSMDDRQENCRVRLRTTSGHQILLDDTNERIYISTSQGNNWIEMDRDGNIDVHTSNKLNIHGTKEVNITSDETIRLFGKKGVHIQSGAEISLTAVADFNLRAVNARLHASDSGYFQTGSTLNLKAGSDVNVDAGSSANVKSGGDTNVQSGGNLGLGAGGDAALAGSNVGINGGRIDIDGGPTPGGAASADPAGEKPALFVDRIPQHEPWPRTMTKDDTTTAPEFAYDDPQVNRSERGRTIDRGSFWRR